LTPLTERPAVVVRNERLNDTIPSLIRLRADGQNVNQALKTYMVKQYVVSREDYHAADFLRNSNFVIAHSDAATAASYLASVGPDNPRNPAALLGAYGTRTVSLGSVRFESVQGSERAIVRFSTELGGSAPAGRTQWTATIDFNYSDAVVTETTDPETGEVKVSLQQPTFQVVNYVLSQS
jgi:type IV secretory pathway component VirB8